MEPDTPRSPNRAAWMVVGLVALVAVLAVVFLFTRSDGFGDANAARGEPETALQSAGRQVEEAGQEAGDAVSRAGKRVEEDAPPADEP